MGWAAKDWIGHPVRVVHAEEDVKKGVAHAEIWLACAHLISNKLPEPFLGPARRGRRGLALVVDAAAL